MNDDFGFIPEQQVSNNSVDDFGFIPEQTQKANSTKKVATPRPQVKYLPNGEIDTEDYKKNLDQYYDIPQTELPQRERIVNSDGVLQGCHPQAAVMREVRNMSETIERAYKSAPRRWVCQFIDRKSVV